MTQNGTRSISQEIYFSGEEAVEIGLAHEIGEFSPPPGTPKAAKGYQQF